MGRSRRPPAKRAHSDSDEGAPSKSVIFLSSSDDEEANRDLSLEIVERARDGELKRKREEDGEVVVVSTDSSEDIRMNFNRGDFEEVKDKKTKKKKSNKKKKKKEVQAAAAAATEAVDDVPKEEEPVGTCDSVITEANEAPDNAILRKLLRGPRYFDPGDRASGACFNCGEEGHNAVDCTKEKREKPCFFCGMFGHIAKRCTQGQDCYTCKRRGHIAKNCPFRHNCTPQDSLICLRCGDLGHDMASCKNDYALDDLKEIQCYVCKNYGHLCCVDLIDNVLREVSCYNCAQPGHTGLGCTKSRGEMIDEVTPSRCFRCGEEGHFARGCTKKSGLWEGGSSTPRIDEVTPSRCFKCGEGGHFKRDCTKSDRWEGGSSTPRIDEVTPSRCFKCGEGGHFVRDCTKSDRRDGGSSTPRRDVHRNIGYMNRSAPHYLGKAMKRREVQYEDEYDDRRRPVSRFARNNHAGYYSPEVHYSTPQSPFKKGTPYSYTSNSRHYHGWSTPR